MRGDAPSLDELLAHVGWVERLSQQLCRDRHAAADAAQETWLQALRSPPQDRRNVRAFLATCLRNVLRGRARRDARRVQREQSVAQTSGIASSFAEASAEVAERAAWHRALANEVQSLSEPQRTLVLLHYLEDREVAAVAQQCELTPDAVRAHLRRARAVLRARMEKRSGNAGLATVVVAATMGMKAKLGIGAVAAALVCWFAVSVVPVVWGPGTPSPLLPVPAEQRDMAVLERGRVEGPVAFGENTSATTRETQSVQRQVTCRLVGLHADATWTTPVHVDIGGVNKAKDFYPKGHLQLLPDADGAFVIDLPAWVEQCVDQFRVIVRAHDPFYLELQEKDYSPSFAASPYGRDGVMEFAVTPCGVLTGAVQTASGDPVPAVAVHALSLRGSLPVGSVQPMAFSGDQGQFRLQVPMHAEVMVVAMPTEMTVISGMRLTRPDGGVAGSGRLRDDLQAAATRASVAFGRGQDVGVLTLEPTGVVPVEVRANGRPVPSLEVECRLPQLWAVDIAHQRLIGLPDGRVHAVPGLWSSQRLRLNLEGQCVLHLPSGLSGEVKLMRNAKSSEPLVATRRVTAGEPCLLDLVGPLRVQVVQAGVAVAGAEVVVDGVDERYRTDADGEVKFARERAAPVPLTIHVPGCAPFAAVAPGEFTDVVVISVSAPKTVPVRLHVTSDSFLSLMGGVLEPIDSDVTAIRFGCRRVEGEPFVFEAPPGRYRLRLLPRYDRGELPLNTAAYLCDHEQVFMVADNGVDVRVDATLGGRLTIDIVDRTGVRLAGDVRLIGPARVELRPRFWHHEAPGEFGVMTRAEPSKSVSYYPPGTYQVVIDLGAHGVLRREVDLRAEEETRLRVKLP